MLHFDKELKAELNKQVDRFSNYLKKMRTGRAQASTFEDVEVEAYGAQTQLKGLANVVVEGAISVVIHPYDKNVSDKIVEAVQAELGYSGINEGERIRVNLPPLTEEKRAETVKEMRSELESDFKKRIRQIRQDYMQSVEKVEGASEDEERASKKAIQEAVDEATDKLDEMADQKEEEIMSMNS